jgi:hypothetical protein
MTKMTNDLIRYNNFYNQNPQKNAHCVNIHMPGLANSSVELLPNTIKKLLGPQENLCPAWGLLLQKDANSLSSIQHILNSSYAFLILNYTSPNLSLIKPTYNYPDIGGSMPSQNLAWVFTPKDSLTQVFLSK